jgi:hypothetical protein
MASLGLQCSIFLQASSASGPPAVTKFSRNQDGSLTNRSQVLATFLPSSQQPKQPAPVAEDGEEDEDEEDEGKAAGEAAGGSSGGAKPAKKKKSGNKKKKGKK